MLLTLYGGTCRLAVRTLQQGRAALHCKTLYGRHDPLPSVVWPRLNTPSLSFPVVFLSLVLLLQVAPGTHYKTLKVSLATCNLHPS